MEQLLKEIDIISIRTLWPFQKEFISFVTDMGATANKSLSSCHKQHTVLRSLCRINLGGFS